MIVESFLQANVKTRTKYKCCMLYHCQRENKVTLDPYYITKSIIFNIIKAIPSISNYIRLQDQHDFLKEMIASFGKQQNSFSTDTSSVEDLLLQREYPDILVKFFKVLSELKLDFNIGIFITGIENLYTKADQNRFESFILLLRSCSLYFPSFLKIVLTMEKRPSKSGVTEKVLQLLATRNVLEIKDAETFENEGKSYLEFALNYGVGSKEMNQAEIQDQ